MRVIRGKHLGKTGKAMKFKNGQVRFLAQGGQIVTCNVEKVSGVKTPPPLNALMGVSFGVSDSA